MQENLKLHDFFLVDSEYYNGFGSRDKSYALLARAKDWKKLSDFIMC
jgi:hypothetical protein